MTKERERPPQQGRDQPGAHFEALAGEKTNRSGLTNAIRVSLSLILGERVEDESCLRTERKGGGKSASPFLLGALCLRLVALQLLLRILLLVS